MNNNYQLAGNLQTTGWHPSFDVNAKNDYGMTPAEVALQAGNLDEFVVITSHPDFEPVQGPSVSRARPAAGSHLPAR